MGKKGSHVLSLSFLSFGLKGGLAERKVGQVFLISFPCYGWGNNGRAWSFNFFKNRSLVGGKGGREVEIHWKVTCVINFEISSQSAKKSILEHFPKFLSYFIIIW
jgi:hypothetical protein